MSAKKHGTFMDGAMQIREHKHRVRLAGVAPASAFVLKSPGRFGVVGPISVGQ